jgi:hypothetical protein
VDRKNKVILSIMVIAIILAINFNQIKRHSARQEIARAAFTEAMVAVNEYMKGIDFSKPVTTHHMKKGEIVIQYQTPNSPQGNFYGLYGSTPDELGINKMGYDPAMKVTVLKERRVYVVIKDFDVVMSYAAPVVDDWSTPEDETRVGGKNLQIFTTCKECFELEDL